MSGQIIMIKSRNTVAGEKACVECVIQHKMNDGSLIVKVSNSLVLSYYERQELTNMIDELKLVDVIKDRTSPFVSSLLLVKKRSEKIHICVDYRSLNKDNKR
ncbi:hypothetical protein HZH68_001105 [Vespula germanica]|uniref:Reverse transcriptase n=1 Tax=Vespula germanica TaxID=30212 RepID=A0A834NV05_VESGE|nr:hypothetical protein HZH68_001105 [Vespula germanica]